MAVQDTKAIVFDCFGVLYTDSRQSLLEAVPTARRQELADLFTSNNYGYSTRAEYLDEVARITDMTVDQVQDYIAHEHQLNKPMVEYIKNELKPQCKIGLLSNIGRQWIDDFFSKHQLHELFDQVILSGEEGIVKPQPAIFELMATRLGLATNECVMIDDIAENCYGAVQAGMQSIQYFDNSQLLIELRQVLGERSK